MNKDLIIALLALAFAGAAAALLVTLAKLQEEKERRWDEISLWQSIEKEKDAEIARLNACLDAEVEYVDNVIDEKTALQDELSALRCPRNDHIWIDGVCKRCGRIQDANARRVRDE